MFIADPSFRNWGGHHAVYNLAVWEALKKIGVEAVILANLAVELGLSKPARVVGVFSRTDLGVPTAEPMVRCPRHRLIMRVVFLLAVPAVLAAKPLRAILDFLEKIPASAPTSCWNRVRAGLLRYRPSDRLVWPTVCQVVVNYFELLESLEDNDFGPGDLLFAPTVTAYTLPMWALMAARLTRRKNSGRLTLMFRYPPDFIRVNPLGRLLWRGLARAAGSGTVQGVTDSVRLAGEYRKLWPRPLSVFPVPTHALAPCVAAGLKRPLKYVCLGNARAKKGFVEFLGAIRLLAEEGLPLHFALQANDPDAGCAEDLAKFINEAPEGVELHRSPFAPEEYRQLLASADVMVFPYWPEVYFASTSGIVIEALVAGKVIVATRGTWLAEELKRFKAGCELVPDHDIRALAEALKAVDRAPEPYFTKAALASAAVRQFHNADVLAALLLNDSNPHRDGKESSPA